MTTTDTTAETRRATYTAGLRALADLLDAHPEVPLPYAGSSSFPISVTFLSGPDPKAALVAAARVFPGPHRKDVREGEYGNYFDLAGALHGLHYQLTAYREEVCERIVTGTREETVEVPDPEALAAVPTVTLTKTVEDVEWRCAPLLNDAAVTA